MGPKEEYLRQLAGDQAKKVKLIIDYSTPCMLCNNQITNDMLFKLPVMVPSYVRFYGEIFRTL